MKRTFWQWSSFSFFRISFFFTGPAFLWCVYNNSGSSLRDLFVCAVCTVCHARVTGSFYLFTHLNCICVCVCVLLGWFRCQFDFTTKRRKKNKLIVELKFCKKCAPNLNFPTFCVVCVFVFWCRYMRVLTCVRARGQALYYCPIEKKNSFGPNRHIPLYNLNLNIDQLLRIILYRGVRKLLIKKFFIF